MFNFLKKKKNSKEEVEHNQNASVKYSDIVIRYTYDWDNDVPLNERIPCNQFCEKMMDIAKRKVWSRMDIENISERLGYSVWDRRGAWIDIGHTDENGNPIEYKWTKNGIEQNCCKHVWKELILKKK
jgi:hypothetical protein